MKVRLFSAGGGDCFLVSASDGKANLLIDGGMKGTYREHVAPFLAEHVPRLSLVCVSHADSDHVRGIIELFENELAWRVHDYQKKTGNTEHLAPEQPRSPTVDMLWHNGIGVRDEVAAGAIETMLFALATIESGSARDGSSQAALACSSMATSIGEGRALSRLTGTRQLGIALNPQHDGKPIHLRSNATDYTFESLDLRLIGPHKDDLDRLERSWQTWIETLEGAESISAISRHVSGQGTAALEVESVALNNTLERAALDLDNASTTLARQFNEVGTRTADRTRVSVPNLASITFVLREGDQSLLCTGDAYQQDIEAGLRLDDSYDVDTGVHFTAIKVPHHGSEHNSDSGFWRRFTANHYLICANGTHHNPDIRVLDELIDARLEDEPGGAAHTGQPFTLWFDTAPQSERANAHLGEMIDHVNKRAGEASCRGRLNVRVAETGSIELNLEDT